MVRIIPVIDVMGGRVVRAVGGRRSEYRPLISRLTDSTDPATVAQTLVARTQANILYAADLDAITGTALPTVLDLGMTGAEVWLDRGIRTVDDLGHWPRDTNKAPVIGSETARDPAQIAQALFTQGEQAVVSVDLKQGNLLTPAGPAVATAAKANHFIDTFASAGCCRAVILLDLAAVGEGNGPGAIVFRLLDQLRSRWAKLEFAVGGGVRNRDDLYRLHNTGADAVLVASALHDGDLP